jgi:hypothetical protein
MRRASSSARPRALPALLTGVALILATAPVASAVPSPPISALTLQGQGGWLENHDADVFTSAGWFQVQREAGAYDHLEVFAGEQQPDASLSLSAPPSELRLVVGRTYTIGSYPDNDKARLTLSIDHRGCGTPTGTFTVLGLTRDGTDQLTSLAVDYSLTACDSTVSYVRGSLRWNSDIAFRHTTSTGFRAPATVAGHTARGSITLTNAGSVAQAYGATGVSGGQQPDAAPVTITQDGCAGVTLAPGASCQVAVSIPSDGTHHFQGYLRTPDETQWGASFTAVSMTAVAAPTAPAVTATPTRGGVRLSTTTWSSAFRVLRATAGGPETEVAHDVAMPWTDTAVSEGTTYTYRVRAVTSDVASAPSSPVTTGPLHVPVGAEGELVAIDPVRVLDTRYGLGARQGPIGAGQTLTFDPAADGDIPSSGVGAVLLNVTGTEPTSATHLRVWPAGDPIPDTSSVNLAAGQSRPNQVVVPVGADGKVSIYNAVGSTHVIVDVQGFYSAAGGDEGGGYHPVDPWRALDTRTDDGWSGSAEPLAPWEEFWLPLNVPGSAAGEVTAVDVNLTITEPGRAGHLIAWPGDTEAPAVSNANFVRGQTVANHAVVPVSYDEWGTPGIAFRNGSDGTTHLIVDIQGWYDDGVRADGLRFAATATSRVADTRAGRGRLADNETLVVPSSSLPPAVAHVVNLTATGSVGPGHLIAWSGEGSPPTTSAVNFVAGEDSPNLATLRAAANGQVAVTARSTSVHVIVDDLGIFY